MENIDSYLHKKFKKQVNVDIKVQNDKENKNLPYLEQNEEKIDKKEKHNQVEHHPQENQISDNKDGVPNQSTNSSSLTVNAKFVKSSISLENQQSSNSYISYVVSKQLDHQPASFDTKFKSQTNYTHSTSSILDPVYPTSNYKYTDGAYVPYTHDEFSSRSEEVSGSKNDEIQPTPDKNSSGKYVCPYCNLVCSKPSVLQKHIRAHTNERPYPCESCGFSFKTRSNLYKHCRSRTHANRLMGTKSQDSGSEVESSKTPAYSSQDLEAKEEQQKPYKPRFHTAKHFNNVHIENTEEEQVNQNSTSQFVSHHINEIINKNNSVVSSSNQFSQKDVSHFEFKNNKEPVCERSTDEPLNLTNKNRKRSMSEVSEPVIQKSLIKELLLKNLSSSDMQCPYCKMIFQTVTELDVHKYRSCKGKPSGAKYSRSSSVNVASILTHNKNAFDNIPQLQNTVFPLNSPGPFLGKTRLIESDKSKSFSFDGGNLPLVSPGESSPSRNYLLSPLFFDKDKKSGIKLFGGEVKIHTAGDMKSFKIDGKEGKYEEDKNYIDYGAKLSENRVVKTSLQSGGTVLTNNSTYKPTLKTPQEIIRMSPNIDIGNFNKSRFNFDKSLGVSMENDSLARSRELIESPKPYSDESSPLYKNIMDFSQRAIKMLTPNIKPPVFTVSSKPIFNNISTENKDDLKISSPKPKLVNDAYYEPKSPNLYNPLNLYVNGQVVRYVPGMPGPVIAAEAPECSSNIVAVPKLVHQATSPLAPIVLDRLPVSSKIRDDCQQPPDKSDRALFLQPEKVPDRFIRSPNSAIQNDKISKITNSFLQPERSSKSPKLDISDNRSDLSSKSIVTKMSEQQKTGETKSTEEVKKFVRPSSLALKPTMASLKQHHGLTPTMFNQILISPDTPRVAKKYAEHFLHGNYFSYLGLKSSTRPVYCTLNKTQPFYVPFFKKLSMYSEWRQQDTKQDKLYVSHYDSRQRNPKYTVAGKTSPNLIIHSSYKFIVSETSSSQSERDDGTQKSEAILGGYECSDDYIYVRGRGRGRYVCNQCGIRCKKPSMLKKHIRTHSNDRPYTCSHCNFSFKTKGNLTKHMKSKAHSKNSTTSNGSSSSSAQQSAQSSDSETEDSGMDSSDESTRQQEHEAAYGLLSLSQKPSQTSGVDLTQMRSKSPSENFMTTEEIAHVSKTNYAKNKFLDEQNSVRNSGFNSRSLEVNQVSTSIETAESQNIRIYLGMGSISRPLTYPYTTILSVEALPSPKITEIESTASTTPETKSIKQFHVIQRYIPQPKLSPKILDKSVREPVQTNKSERISPSDDKMTTNNIKNNATVLTRPLPTLKINDVDVTNDVSDLRKRKFSNPEPPHKNKIQKNDEVMDLSMANNQDKLLNGFSDEIIVNSFNSIEPPNNVKSYEHLESHRIIDNSRNFEHENKVDDFRSLESQKNVANEILNTLQKVPSPRLEINENKEDMVYKSSESTNNGTVLILRQLQSEDQVNVDYHDSTNEEPVKNSPYDNSAMETLADIATKQVKLEKNTLAKSVASEFLKLATKNENVDGSRDYVNFGPINKDVNEIVVKSEGNKSCTICSKSFNKPSQLRLHMNIHYIERPFRCDSCSVSFRTKGHLQKHERSASHNNKLSSSPALSSSEPRPFKCSDCNIAFRIHGHLAKHLRSKLHIQKLECLAKIPFGLYAELERSNSLLTEINTCDGDQCLESLKTLAKKVFINDPNKVVQLEPRENINAD